MRMFGSRDKAVLEALDRSQGRIEFDTEGNVLQANASFLDLLDTERTLLEFAVSAERARADRGQALARLNTLVGEAVPTEPTTNPTTEPESNAVQPLASF